MTAKPQSVVLFIRVSTDEQADSGLGLSAQLHACEALAKLNGWTIAAVFREEGISGGASLLKRPVLLSAIDSLEEGQIFLVAKRDRLSRGDVFTTSIIEMAVGERGCRVISAANEGTWEDTPQSRFQRRILDAVAALEKEQTQERTVNALKVKRAQGELYSPVPYGFKLGEPTERKDGNSVRIVQTLVADEGEAAALELIARWKAEGKSLGEIARGLDLAGVSTKSGGKWARSSIQRLLARIGGKPAKKKRAGGAYRPVREFLEGVKHHGEHETSKKTG